MLKKKKIKVETIEEIVASGTKSQRFVLVGTYKKKPDQLAWIRKRHVYNYPLSAEEAKPGNEGWSKVKELWLYSGAKDRRHIYESKFIGIKPRQEFLADYPDYPTGGSRSRATAHGDFYAVFSVKHKYQPTIEDSKVVVRTKDFSKRTPKIAQAVKAYQAGGELGSLCNYLPAELSPLSHDQLRVCEAVVQLDFLCELDVSRTMDIVGDFACQGDSLRHDARLTCLDFFAGSGLVSVGLSSEFRTVWANDISQKKALVFNANNKAGVLQVCPIENISGKVLPTVDLSWGSFPCQDLSLAGDIKGLYASRSGLFWQWLRVMDEMPVRPPVVVAENVIGFVSAAGGQYYVDAHEELIKRGYRVGAVMLDAANWLPQSRKRIFVIGVHGGVDISALTSANATWCHPDPIVKVAGMVSDWVWWKIPMPRSRKQILDELVDFDSPCDSEAMQSHKLSLIAEEKIHQLKELSRGCRRAFTGYRRTRNHKQVLEVRTDGMAGCLRTPCGGSSRQILIIATDGKLRTRLLTVRETARLMGVPDSYKIPGSYNDGYMAMGDAVAVPVVEYLSSQLLAPLGKAVKKKGRK